MNKFIRFFKDRPKFNLSIDLLMFMLLMSMAGIGFLIKYVLIRGSQRNLLYGEDVDLQFLGLNRHQWGAIHLWISIAFLIFIVLHIILHWKMIVCIFKSMVLNKARRIAITILIVIIGMLLIAFAFLIKPNQIYHDHLHRNKVEKISTQNITKDMPDKMNISTNLDSKEGIKSYQEEERKNNVNSEVEHHHNEKEYEIFGYLTLKEVAFKYNVPSEYLCNCLNISKDNSNEKLGRLKKKYPFTMTDLCDCISKYKKQNR